MGGKRKGLLNRAAVCMALESRSGYGVNMKIEEAVRRLSVLDIYVPDTQINGVQR